MHSIQSAAPGSQNLTIRCTTKERNSVETTEIKICSNKPRFYMLIKRRWCIFTYVIAGLKTAIWWESVCLFLFVYMCCVVFRIMKATEREIMNPIWLCHEHIVTLSAKPPTFVLACRCLYETDRERERLWACVCVWLWHFIVIFSPRQCQRKSGWPSPSFWSCGSQHWPPLL